MPTVAAGTSASATLAGSQTIALALDPNEEAQVSIARSGAQVYGASVRTSMTIGPYLSGDVLTITAARGAVDYTLASYSDPAIDAVEIAAIQALVSGDGLRVLGTQTLDDCILLGSNASVWIAPGSTIINGGAVQHTMIRTGNAEFKADATPIPGVTIYCADEAASAGSGTLRYTTAGTSLAWLAPGELSYGSEVNISAVVSAATVGIFIIPGAVAGKAIYVYVAPASRAGGVTTRTVRVEPVTGARAITWTRLTNLRTVTETWHGRRVGDFVINFGPSGDVSHGFITAVTANTYALPDTGTDQGAALVGRAYGVRNVSILGNGATLNYNKPGLPVTLMSNLHAVILNACNDVTVERLQVNNCTKYALLVTGYKRVEINGFSSYRDDSAVLDGNSDVVHPLGPGNGIRITGTRAQGGDNLVGVGCADFYDYVFNCPAYGDLSLNDGRVTDSRGEDTDQQPVRFYNANGSNWIRNWIVDGVAGTYSSGSDSAVAVIMDTMSGGMVDSGQTNIDGLTVTSPDAVRSDGVVTFAVKFGGAGTRRNIRLLRVRPRACTAAFRATVWVDVGTTTDDLHVEFDSGPTFSGYLVGLTGTANVGRLTVRASGSLNGNNEVGGTFAPALAALDSSTSVLGYLDASGIVITDLSSTGTKLRTVLNNGTIGEIAMSDVRIVNADSLIRYTSIAAPGSRVRLRNINAGANFVGVFDNGAPTDVNLDSVWHNSAANALWTVADATARAITLRAVNCRGGNRFLRNVQGGHTYTLSGYGNAPGAGAAIVTDAGTPTYRLDGDWDLVTDGALLDATVANHRAGAKFYNTNAGFSSGVGAYVRGATTWVRVAA